MTKKIKAFLGIILILFLTGCNNSNRIQEGNLEQVEKHNYINIKYRNSPVDLEKFEEINTSKSSLIRGAWYDENNNYFIINIRNTYYHYCGLPNTIWYEFKKASSFGKYFKSKIKGKYDCRYVGEIPKY